MTAEHTPGTWEWVRVSYQGSVTEFTLKGPNVLCRYWYDKPPTADALLIAAAPETAAERDRFEAALNRIAWDVDNGHPLGDSGIFMQQIARAVLPKPPEPV